MTEEEKQSLANVKIENNRQCEQAIKKALKEYKPDFIILTMAKLEYILDDDKVKIPIRTIEVLNKGVYKEFIKGIGYELIRLKQLEAKEKKGKLWKPGDKL